MAAKNHLVKNKIYQLAEDHTFTVRYQGKREGVIVTSNHTQYPVGAKIERISLNRDGLIDLFCYTLNR